MRFLSFFFASFIFSSLFSQEIGSNTYQFLTLNNSARIAALGGNLISVKDDDPNLAVYNASLLNEDMDGKLGLNYMSYFAGIKQGYATYAKHYEGVGTFAASMQYVNYGKFTQTDYTGAELGKFNVGEYALNIAGSKAIDTSFSIGANVKFIYSSLEVYNSMGVAADLSGTYHRPDKNFTAALVIKNMGTQLTSYYEGAEKAQLPFEIQLGISKRLRHSPIRFSIVAENLQKWDLTYEDPNQVIIIDPVTQEIINEVKYSFANKLMRHIVLGSEISITKNFNIRVGYNYRRRQELKVDTRTGGVGISWGLGFRISKFHLSYGRASYHLSGASNLFSLSIKPSDFRKQSSN